MKDVKWNRPTIKLLGSMEQLNKNQAFSRTFKDLNDDDDDDDDDSSLRRMF